MTGIGILLALTATGVDYGWQRGSDGELEYIIQLEPELLESLERGGEIVSVIPPEAAGAKSFRIRIGEGSVPRESLPVAPISNMRPAVAEAADDDAKNPTGDQPSRRVVQKQILGDPNYSDGLSNSNGYGSPSSGGQNTYVSPDPYGARNTSSNSSSRAAGVYSATNNPRSTTSTSGMLNGAGSANNWDATRRTSSNGGYSSGVNDYNASAAGNYNTTVGGNYNAAAPSGDRYADSRFGQTAGSGVYGAAGASTDPRNQANTGWPQGYNSGSYNSGGFSELDGRTAAGANGWNSSTNMSRPPYDGGQNYAQYTGGPRLASNDGVGATGVGLNAPTNPIGGSRNTGSAATNGLGSGSIAAANPISTGNSTVTSDSEPFGNRTSRSGLEVPSLAESALKNNRRASDAGEERGSSMTLAFFALFISLSGNAYLTWICWGIHERYRRLANQLARNNLRAHAESAV